MTSDDSGDPPDPAPARGDRERGDRGGERDRERGDRGGDRGGGDRDLSETLRARLEQLVPDLVRRTFTAGLGAVFSTEEGIRKVTRELQLPNVAGYLADTADNTKDKVLEIIAREVREFLAHVNLSDEVAKLLTTLSFEIKTEIRFIPNSERYTGVDPDVKAQVRLKRADSKDEREGDDRDDKDDPGRLRRLWRRATGNGDHGHDGDGDDDGDGPPEHE